MARGIIEVNRSAFATKQNQNELRAIRLRLTI